MIVGHGFGVDPHDDPIRIAVDALGADGRLTDERIVAVEPAYLSESPSVADAMEALGSRAPGAPVLVAPLLLSRGYFADRVLPERLRGCKEERPIRIAPPIGTHPAIVGLAREMIDASLRTNPASDDGEESVDSEQVGILLVGHGTERHTHSSASTRACAAGLRRLWPERPIDVAFLDEEPRLSPASLAAIRRERSVVLPFLIATGHHTRSDIPRLLELSADADVVITPPIGTHPHIPRLVLLCADAMMRG